MARIEYEITVGTEESNRRLELLHENIRRFGTIYNTLFTSTDLTGIICRT
jgi:hypothetical protein